jgi:phosphate transport system permease protein
MLIELLAGVPSVVYGLLGILLLRDWIYEAFVRFDPLSGDTLLTAGVLLAVMVLPTIVTLGDDALRAVPAAQRRTARALGMTRAETILYVTLPQARRGLGAALLLGIGRALGETIAVFLVVGRQDNNLPERWLSLHPLLESGQTLTSKLGSSETNIGYGDPLHWAAIVGLGLILLLLTGGLTLLATGFGRRTHA